MNYVNTIWLPEPKIPDESYAKRGEHTLDWLSRGTNSDAQKARFFLNHNLARLPINMQASLHQSLKFRWSSAFFELIVARTLQMLGAELQIEEVNASGKRPDFTATFPEGTVIIEAIAPEFNKDVHSTRKDQEPLLEFIQSYIPSNWDIGIYTLPIIGPNDSKKEFQVKIQQMLSRVPDKNSSLEYNETISSGKIRFFLRPGTGQIIIEPGISTVDDSKTRIKHAIQKKRGQVRHSSHPVLLAVHASGISSNLEDFNQVLFGTTCSFFNEQNQLERTGFLPNGIFNLNPRSHIPPTYAGLLAFTEIGFRGGKAPVLYHHPRFAGSIPDSLLRLEQRKYNATVNEIHSVATKAPNFMDQFNFV